MVRHEKCNKPVIRILAFSAAPAFITAKAAILVFDIGRRIRRNPDISLLILAHGVTQDQSIARQVKTAIGFPG